MRKTRPTAAAPGGRGRRAPLGRATALLAAAAVHAILLWAIILPAPRGAGEPRPLVLVPPAASPPEARRPRPPGAAPEEPISRPGREAEPADRRPEPTPAVAEPAISRAAPRNRTIPSTALRELRAAPLPLVLTPRGVERRAPEVDERRLAVLRAESLLQARLTSLPGTEREPERPVGLADGGVTVRLPWGGFLPEHRRDGRWREERCREGGDGEDDKPGEDEARRAQCG